MRIYRNIKFLLTLLAIGIGFPSLSTIARGDVNQCTGQLGLVVNTNNNREIFLANVDGSGIQNLTNNPANDNSPTFSPDGSYLAFVSNRDGNQEIYILDVDKGLTINLTHNSAEDYNPIWSVDGKKLAFLRGDNRYTELYIVDSNGDNLHLLAGESGLIRDPKWSPDGQHIIFSAHINEPQSWGNIYSADVNDNQITRLTDISAENNPNAVPPIFLTWSPDGKKISFGIGYVGSPDYKLFLMNSDGSKANLIFDQEITFPISWSPDSQFIVLTSFDEDIETLNINTGEIRTLVGSEQGLISNGWPVWFPDKSCIAFSTLRNGSWGVYVIDPDSGEMRKVEDNLFLAASVVITPIIWRPQPATSESP